MSVNGVANVRVTAEPLWFTDTCTVTSLLRLSWALTTSTESTSLGKLTTVYWEKRRGVVFNDIKKVVDDPSP
jgi:hypothetical protein